MQNIDQLRPWQAEVLVKSVNWYTDPETDNRFLIDAAPGAGKTLAACIIAAELLDKQLIDRVIVIAPRSEVVNQWAKEFKNCTGLFMGKVTGSDEDYVSMEYNLCATWAAVQGLSAGFQEVCRRSRTFVICDEHHHAAVAAAWGGSADSAFDDAEYVLILSGTPVRSDGEQTVWLAYNENGTLDRSKGGSYTLTYGEAVDLGYCRPVTFHRHQGHFDVRIDETRTVRVSGCGNSRSADEVDEFVKEYPPLKKVLNFYKLAQTPIYCDNTNKPDLSAYQGSMLEEASLKLDEVRLKMPNAGGLVIAPNIQMAEYFCELIKEFEGEEPVLVHSEKPGSDRKIAAFRETDCRWIVSVAMISEGVDIPRLRVLIYLSNSQTELSFRQSIGRIVRTSGYNDSTRGYVVMPAFEIFDVFAKRIEAEMPAVVKAPTEPKFKTCPICENQCGLHDKECHSCGHVFEKKERPPRQKVCHECGSLNPINAETCINCGASFSHAFSVSLADALRDGAIVRGIDLTEDEVRNAEKFADDFETAVLRDGDAVLMGILSKLPRELLLRLSTLAREHE